MSWAGCRPGGCSGDGAKPNNTKPAAADTIVVEVRTSPLTPPKPLASRLEGLLLWAFVVVAKSDSASKLRSAVHYALLEIIRGYTDTVYFIGHKRSVSWTGEAPQCRPAHSLDALSPVFSSLRAVEKGSRTREPPNSKPINALRMSSPPLSRIVYFSTPRLRPTPVGVQYRPLFEKLSPSPRCAWLYARRRFPRQSRLVCGHELW